MKSSTFLDYEGNMSALSDLGTNDLSFDINPNFLNELMMSSSPTSNDLITNCGTTGTGGMEVDQDVAGWLDSLLPNQSPQGTKTHNIGAGHDSGIGEMNGNQESPMRSSSSANMMLDSGRNTVNNNLQQGNTSTMIGSQTDSFLDDSDMIMSTLHSPVSVQHKF